MTLLFVLQKCKVVFDSDEEMLETELVGGTDLRVSCPVEEDESGGRGVLSIMPPSAEEDLEGSKDAEPTSGDASPGLGCPPPEATEPRW